MVYAIPAFIVGILIGIGGWQMYLTRNDWR